MRFTSLVLFFLFACVAGLPHLYLESRQNNGTALMKRGNAQRTLRPPPGKDSKPKRRTKKSKTKRPTALYEDAESFIIAELRSGEIPNSWVQKVCTDTEKEQIAKTPRSVIHTVKFTLRGKSAYIVTKEVEWMEADFNKEVDRLKQVHQYLGHGHKKGSKKRYLVMQYLGVASSYTSLELDSVDEAVKEAKIIYQKKYGLGRDPEPSSEYTFKRVVNSENEVEWDRDVHPVGNWRNAKEIAPNPKFTHLKVAPLKVNNYWEW